MTRRYLALMIAPVSQSNGHTVENNITTAKLWYPFLRELTADMPITIVCPWLVGILLGDDDNSPEQRERGIVDSETGAARCDLTIAVGQAPSLTTGMQREHAACPGPCVDLLDLGRGEYPLGFPARSMIRERIRQALRSLDSVEAETLRPGDVVQIIGAGDDGSNDVLGCLATVVDEAALHPVCPPNPGGVPVYLHSHADGLWGRIRRDRLTRIGRAAMVASPSPDLAYAPVITTSSVARDVEFKPAEVPGPWPAGPWPTDEEERRGRTTWPGDEP